MEQIWVDRKASTTSPCSGFIVRITIEQHLELHSPISQERQDHTVHARFRHNRNSIQKIPCKPRYNATGTS